MKNYPSPASKPKFKFETPRMGWRAALLGLCALCVAVPSCSKDSEHPPHNADQLSGISQNAPLDRDGISRVTVPELISTPVQLLIENAETCDVFYLEEEAYSDLSKTDKPLTEALESCRTRLTSGAGVFGRQEVKGTDLQPIPSMLYSGIGNGGPISHCFLPEIALHFRHGTRDVLILLCFSCNCILILEESPSSVEKHSLGAGRDLRKQLYALLGREDLIK